MPPARDQVWPTQGIPATLTQLRSQSSHQPLPPEPSGCTVWPDLRACGVLSRKLPGKESSTRIYLHSSLQGCGHHLSKPITPHRGLTCWPQATKAPSCGGDAVITHPPHSNCLATASNASAQLVPAPALVIRVQIFPKTISLAFCSFGVLKKRLRGVREEREPKYNVFTA